MKLSNTKKRRLDALNQHRTAGGAAQAAAQKQPQLPAAVTAPAQQATAGPAASDPGVTTLGKLGVFPYNPLSSTLAASHTAAKLLLPPTSGCQGNVEDILEQLMTPHMPPITARNMISSRTVDKSVVLDNPTAKLNITKPSKANRTRKQQLAGKLLPRAKRNELTQLPSAGIDYTALLSLHELWEKYASGLLSGKADTEQQRLLQGLDWHGAVVRVTSAKHSTYIGRAGIVAKATANTFVLVSMDGRSSIVPFKGAVFECVVPGPNLVVELAGASLSKLQCSVKPTTSGPVG